MRQDIRAIRAIRVRKMVKTEHFRFQHIQTWKCIYSNLMDFRSVSPMPIV